MPLNQLRREESTPEMADGPDAQVPKARLFILAGAQPWNENRITKHVSPGQRPVSAETDVYETQQGVMPWSPAITAARPSLAFIDATALWLGPLLVGPQLALLKRPFFATSHSSTLVFPGTMR